MLHFGVLEDTLGAEHRSVILAVELNLLGRMDVTIPDGGHDLVWVVDISLARTVVHSHWQSGHYRIIYGQVLRYRMMSNLVVGALDHLVLV
jgi:hypothetical protein